MAIPVARVHLKVAHAALPGLLPTPPKWKTLPQLPPPPPCVAAKRSKPPLAKPGRADSDERCDAHKAKAKSACPASSASPSSSGCPRSPDSFTRTAGHGSPRPKNASSPPPPLMPGRADSIERWDANKKVGIQASSSSSPGTSSLPNSSNKLPISRATSSDKERSPPQDDQRRLDDRGSSSTGSDDIDMEEEEEEEILWKPRAMYAGPGFAVAAAKSSVLPMPTAFLVPVA